MFNRKMLNNLLPLMVYHRMKPVCGYLANLQQIKKFPHFSMSNLG